MRVDLKNLFNLNAGDECLDALVVEPRFPVHHFLSRNQSLASQARLALTCSCAIHGVDCASNAGVTLDNFFKLGQFFGNGRVFF